MPRPNASQLRMNYITASGNVPQLRCIGSGHETREGTGGGTPPTQLGGMRKRCKLPHRGLGLRPRKKRCFALKNSESYAKKRRPRSGLSNISQIVYTRRGYNSLDNR